jgi:hypothetical protein
MRFFPPKLLPTWGKALIVVSAAIITLLIALPARVCWDQAFVCENTGSQKGYRRWCIGIQSGHWYNETHLEQFMRREHPSVFVNRWTKYSQIGRNLLGQPSLWRCGFPGPILDCRGTIFDQYVDSLDDKAKLDLYYAFASGQQDQIKEKTEAMWAQAMVSK